MPLRRGTCGGRWSSAWSCPYCRHAR
jgi:hypothetical protein